MSNRTYRLITIIIFIIVASLIVWALINGNTFLPIPAIIAGIVILLLFRRQVNTIIVDERIFSIAEKASLAAYRIFGILAAVTGIILVILGENFDSALMPIGLTLAFSACALLLCYNVAYIYFKRKFGR